MKKEIICTVCPRGCHIQVEGDPSFVTSVAGQGCKRGLEYATNEFIHPVRILTTTVKLTCGELLPVRSSQPVPKEKLFDCMDAIRSITVSAPVERYEVILSDICGTGVDMVATKAAK